MSSDKFNDAKASSGDAKPGRTNAYDISLTHVLTDKDQIGQVLFPGGVDFTNEQRQELLDYYRLVIQNSEQLAARRQNVNSFFLSINSMLMAGVGVIAKETIAQATAPPHHHRNPVVGETFLVIMLCITGLIICRNWEALIKSYARIVQANAIVTEEMEKHLLAAMTTAQQRIHGTDHFSMAKVETRIASAFMVLYMIVLIGALYMLFCVKMNNDETQTAPVSQQTPLQVPYQYENAPATRPVDGATVH